MVEDEVVSAEHVESRTFSDLEVKAMRRFNRVVRDLDLYLVTNPWVNWNRGGAWVVLYLRGKTICGQVCSALEWAHLLDTRLRQSSGDDKSIASDLVETYRDIQDRHDDALNHKADGELSDADIRSRWTPPRSIFLMDAYEVTASGDHIPANGAPMKIRRASVDAWSLGQLERS